MAKAFDTVGHRIPMQGNHSVSQLTLSYSYILTLRYFNCCFKLTTWTSSCIYVIRVVNGMCFFLIVFILSVWHAEAFLPSIICQWLSGGLSQQTWTQAMGIEDCQQFEEFNGREHCRPRWLCLSGDWISWSGKHGISWHMIQAVVFSACVGFRKGNWNW